MLSERARASEKALMEITLAIADTLQTVMLVGRNPGLTVLTNAIGDGSISEIPPISACCIELAMASYTRIWKLHGTIKYFEYPKKRIR